MKLYMAHIIKVGFIVVATGFLFFQCVVQSLGEDPVADSDGDGLIEIKDAMMLNNMRYNLAGTSYKTSADDAGDASGCPASGCNGYELSANIDLLSLLDANNNGNIDTTTVSVAGKTHTVIDISKDTSWVPIGDNSTGSVASRFRGIFEGNNHTIANLWVNVSSSSGNAYAGLFGFVSGTSAEIRNLGIISGSIHSSSSSFSRSGGLVGSSSASPFTITNSYFSGSGGVSSSSDSGSSSFSSRSGGLVGDGSTVSITNSYFSGGGGVSSSAFSSSAGGLVGSNSSLVGSSSSVMITNSYFSGGGGVSSSSSPSSAGGLVGYFDYDLVITNSYFSGGGGVSSSGSGSYYYSSSGGLVGHTGSSSSLMIINSYWNTEAPQMVGGNVQSPKRAHGNASSNPAGTTGITLMQLQATSGMLYPDGLPTQAWDLGTDMQLPAVKTCVNPTVTNNVVTCASYGDLLAGQR